MTVGLAKQYVPAELIRRALVIFILSPSYACYTAARINKLTVSTEFRRMNGSPYQHYATFIALYQAEIRYQEPMRNANRTRVSKRFKTHFIARTRTYIYD